MTRRRSHERLQHAMADARSGRVVFVSHCLLNQNTRYLGGAVCPGAVAGAIAAYIEDGTGLVQMPCPEQRAWGGVLKRRLLVLIEHRWLARAGPVLPAVARPYLRRRYRTLARAVAAEIEDYLASGFTVVGVLGVAGSPSCGVTRTLDLQTALRGLAHCPRMQPTATWMNQAVVEPALRDGRGLFVDELVHEFGRRRLDVPLLEHALVEGSGPSAR